MPDNKLNYERLVREIIIEVDEPLLFIRTLDDMHEDAIRGATYDCATSAQRGDIYTHYKQLRKFLNELIPLATAGCSCKTKPKQTEVNQN